MKFIAVFDAAQICIVYIRKHICVCCNFSFIYRFKNQTINLSKYPKPSVAFHSSGFQHLLSY